MKQLTPFSIALEYDNGTADFVLYVSVILFDLKEIFNFHSSRRTQPAKSCIVRILENVTYYGFDSSIVRLIVIIIFFQYLHVFYDTTSVSRGLRVLRFSTFYPLFFAVSKYQNRFGNFEFVRARKPITTVIPIDYSIDTV